MTALIRVLDVSGSGLGDWISSLEFWCLSESLQYTAVSDTSFPNKHPQSYFILLYITYEVDKLRRFYVNIVLEFFY